VRAASVAVADLRLIVGWIAATATTTTSLFGVPTAE
jgi:hypothetical protein